jgi:hypothetical protein
MLLALIIGVSVSVQRKTQLFFEILFFDDSRMMSVDFRTMCKASTGSSDRIFISCSAAIETHRLSRLFDYGKRLFQIRRRVETIPADERYFFRNRQSFFLESIQCSYHEQIIHDN